MMRLATATVLGLLLVVAACAGTTSRSRLATATADYNNALGKANAYRSAPLCAPGQVSLADKRCSDRSTVLKLQTMAKSTTASIDDANAAVQTSPDAQGTADKIAVVEVQVNNFKGAIPPL